MTPYSTLSHAANEMRLFKLHLESEDALLRRTLFSVLLHLHCNFWGLRVEKVDMNLTNCEEAEPCQIHHLAYEVLSVELGRRFPKCLIKFSEQASTDSSNLVLRRSLYSDKGWVLWVDDLCINSEDLIEHSSPFQRTTTNRLASWKSSYLVQGFKWLLIVALNKLGDI
jgi:hypothetical protein